MNLKTKKSNVVSRARAILLNKNIAAKSKFYSKYVCRENGQLINVYSHISVPVIDGVYPGPDAGGAEHAGSRVAVAVVGEAGAGAAELLHRLVHRHVPRQRALTHQELEPTKTSNQSI